MILSISAIGQPPVKIFAYSQITTPGTIPKGATDENGNRINTKKESPVNYYIFASYNSSAKIRFNEIWIKGKFYRTQMKNIDSTPVVNINETIPGKPVKVELVPAVKGKVISIVPGKTKKSSLIKTAWFINMTKRAELIVSYTYQGKKYFIRVKKIKMLEPLQVYKIFYIYLFDCLPLRQKAGPAFGRTAFYFNLI
jgi:hypothetical protein